MDKMPSGKSYLDPVSLLEKLEVKPGMKVGDFGCGGSGYFTLQAAEMTGDKGQVFAVDIFKPNLSAVWRNVKMRGYDSFVRCIWSDLEIYKATKKIKDETLDRGILVNVLHQSKKQKEILKECTRMIKKEGRILIVEWSSSSKLMFGPQKKEIIDKPRVIQLASEVNLAPMEDFKAGPYHWGLIMTKTA